MILLCRLNYMTMWQNASQFVPRQSLKREVAGDILAISSPRKAASGSVA
jgi:hypothetical protein